MRRSLILLSLLFSVGSIRLNVKLPERRNRILMMHRRLGNREIGQKVCYELLGCFSDRQPSVLKRPPQPPSVIKTQFHLYTRENRHKPEEIDYGDKLYSMKHSKFNASRKLVIIIHGYKGTGINDEALDGVEALLDVEDANVIIVDWAKGAGSTYGNAVSNVELVGRQLGLILLDAVHVGVLPSAMHLIGFSLGAHVAGCASEVLKKHGLLIGRITGLDPASPFFRMHLFREKARKLDSSDARLVDVIHSDGSADFADGFGLLKPIGHIDFFPNGGRQQPGCNDVKNSVVVSHLNENSLDIHIACSHVRSWFLFVESLRSQRGTCKFNTWSCKRRFGSYMAGSCFPLEGSVAAPEMGYAASKGPTGQFYLTTTSEPPYCGHPLRVAVKVSEEEFRPKGVLWVTMESGGSNTTFKVICDQAALPPLSSLNNRNSAQPTFYDIKAAHYDTFATNASSVQVRVTFEAEDVPEAEYSKVLFVEKLSIEDRKGHRWEHCAKNLGLGVQEKVLMLTNESCSQ